MRSGPVYVLLQGIPCELTAAQLRAMAEGAHGLDHVLTYNPHDPGFAVFVFRNKAGARFPVQSLAACWFYRVQPMHSCSHSQAFGMVSAAALLGYNILLDNLEKAEAQMGWWPERIAVRSYPSSLKLYTLDNMHGSGVHDECPIRHCLQVVQRRDLLPPLERVRRLEAMDAADATAGVLWRAGLKLEWPVLLKH